MLALLLCVQLDRHIGIALNEGRRSPLWFLHHIELVEPLHYFFPQYSQLLFRQAVTKAAMNTKPEG